MATPQGVEETKLVHYGVEDGVAILELDDPPANTYCGRRKKFGKRKGLNAHTA
ncbi:MAG: hypothetical protein WCA00_17565 [Candidatus Acidiferrales bacterium]